MRDKLSSEQYSAIESMFNKIVQVKFRNGALGGIRRRNITSKISIKVKTMHGERKTHRMEFSIMDKVEKVTEKLAEIEPQEMLKYYTFRLLFPIGRLQELKTDLTFEQ